MKISRKVWLILGAVILVAALVSVYMIYFQQAGERDALNDKLLEAQTLWSALEKQKTQEGGLEDQLAQAESLLDTSRTRFPESVESIEYGEYLFEIAGDCNVGITKLTASQPTDKKLGTITYSVSSFVIGVSGSIDDILAFIHAVRTGGDLQLPWSAAEVTGVNIDVAGSATINLNIYGYKG